MGWLCLASILVWSAVTFFGVPVDALPEVGGKSGAFLMAISVLSILIEPLFVNYSVSVVYMLISILPLVMAFMNYRKLNRERSTN